MGRASVRAFDEALAEAGLDPSAVDKYVSIDASGTYSVGSVATFTDATAGERARLRRHPDPRALQG